VKSLFQKKFTTRQIIFLIFLILFFGSFLVLRVWPDRLQTAQVEINGEIVSVWLAQTLSQQYKGLGGRQELGRNQGMLFIFSSAKQHAFVMRAMRFSIDIVWINNGVIVDIAPNVEPEPGVEETELRRYYPRVKANIVLELPASWTKEHMVKIGDGVILYNSV